MTHLRLILILAALSVSLTAGPVTIGAGWYGFCFGGVGSGASDGDCPPDYPRTSGNPFTFSAPGNVLLQVTDAFQKGDVFDVFVNSVFRFSTSLVPIDLFGDVEDPDLAFADPTYSSGQLVLPPGDYSVEIFTQISPFGSGGAFLRVSRTGLPPDPEPGVVPEPATFAMMAAGVVTLVLRRRRA